MFTGLVQAIGTIRSVTPRSELVELMVECGSVAGDLSVGDSVAVSGVCLTATEISAASFRADVAQETLRRTTLGALEKGSHVNLELPLRADARLGGHIVQGHVDEVGTVAFAGEREGNYIVRVSFDPEQSGLVVEKGSIALDGVSLTVTANGAGFVEVMLIPHTLEQTTLSERRPGDGIHLEYDILAKYVRELVTPYLGQR